MSGKYKDLYGPMINDETFDLTMSERMGALVALQWLDQNPDQVPGLTMPESEMEHKCATYGSAYETGFRQAGGVVIPAPEPTNFDLLKKFMTDIQKDGLSPDSAAEWLDFHGVKVPGGDDE